MAARHPRDQRIHDPHPQVNGSATPSAHISPAVQASLPPAPNAIIQKLNVANEQTWLLIGRVAEQMGDLEHALNAYENALRHNPMSLSGLTQVAGIARIKENYPKAIEYFQRVLNIAEDNGEVWSALGHCYLMQDDLQKAYSAYQQALYLLPNPKEDPKLWYGIGILYDRYGSLDHAEEAFSSVLRMDKDFDKANEILFRLGIIYKQQTKYEDSLECFDRILRNPPSPLAHADIWFQIGHVFEQQKDYHRAKDAYERVVVDNPNHAKVLQQLGWLYHQDGSAFQNQDSAIQYLTKSLEADPSDAQSWYLLGRAYMAGQKYNKAYEAYQQAVYRDGRNPTFWCSIGVLYFQINQYRDALDAYSRAIRINPYISEVWFDLGSLYESCNNQITDAIDAYARASELDPSNPGIAQRLQLLKQAQANGTQLPAAPGPKDVHPTAYASAVVPPPGLNNPLSLHNHSRIGMRTDSRGPSDVNLPPPQLASGRDVAPYNGGPPPPVVIDDRHASIHPPLAPMEVDRPPHSRDFPPSSRDGRGPAGHQNILLNHASHPMDEARVNAPSHPHADPFFNRRGPRSRSISPAQHSSRPRSPGPYFNGQYPPQRQPVQPSNGPQRSPRTVEGRPTDREAAWEHDRRGPPPPPAEQREWERERERRGRPHSAEFGGPPPAVYQQSPPVPTQRAHTPPQPSPRQSGRYQWDQKAGGPPPHPHHPHGASPPPPIDQRRLERDYAAETRGYPPSPPNARNVVRQTHPHMADGPRRSESPHPSQSVEAKERRRRQTRDSREFDMLQQGPPHQPQQLQQIPLQSPPVTSSVSTPSGDPAGRKERRRKQASRRADGSETPKPEQQRGVKQGYQDGGNASGFRSMQPPYAGDDSSDRVKLMQPPRGPGSPDVDRGYGKYGFKTAASPEPINTGPVGARSVHHSPIATPRPLVRPIDEDYDEGIDALMNLSQQQYRGQPPPNSASIAAGESSRPVQSPTISSGSRGSDPSPRAPPSSHRGSVSSTRSHASPSSQAAQLKRPRSPGSDESDSKRTRTETIRRRSSVSLGRHTPVQSTRPSPIPFRTQPPSHSPESRQPPPRDSYATGSPPPHVPSVVLPPHPRPVGVGHSSSSGSSGSGGNGGGSLPNPGMALPPIATLSPQSSTAASPGGDRDRERDSRDDRMQVDASRSSSPQVRKVAPAGSISSEGSGGRTLSRTPPDSKHTPTPPVGDKKESQL